MLTLAKEVDETTFYGSFARRLLSICVPHGPSLSPTACQRSRFLVSNTKPLDSHTQGGGRLHWVTTEIESESTVVPLGSSYTYDDADDAFCSLLHEETPSVDGAPDPVELATKALLASKGSATSTEEKT